MEALEGVHLDLRREGGRGADDDRLRLCSVRRARGAGERVRPGRQDDLVPRLRVLDGLTHADIHDNLVNSGNLHRIDVAKFLLQGRHDFLLILFFQS